MVDFRNRQDMSGMIQQAYAARAGVPNKGLMMANAGVQGLQQGLQLAETIGGVMEKKKRKKMIQDTINTPEFKALDIELSGIPSVLAKTGDYKGLADLMIKQKTLNTMQTYVDPETGLPKFTIPKSQKLAPVTTEQKLGASEKLAERKSEIQLQKEEKQKDLKLSKLNSAVDFFEQKINEIPSGAGLGGRLKGVGTAIEAKLQTNPKAAAYVASAEGLRSQIVRGLGDVGNLSEYEQKVASNLLPKITDNTETKKAKIQNFRDYIKTRVEFGKESKLDLKQSKPKFEIIGVK